MVDSTENYIEYGTPLEPLEEDEVTAKKPVTVQDQIAVDEQGRRRFHGAFTGGFSAGYYNTVGSKEGWTPSEFKSSRQRRAESSTSRKGQNVQDFMDEEDLGAFGIAPQILRASNDFEQRESRKRSRPGPESSGPIPGVPVLEQIIQPVKETIGIRILQRMGWRPGQGVGPRLSKAERKLEREKRKAKEIAKSESAPSNENEPVVEGQVPDGKIYGCHIPPELRIAQTEASDSEESVIDVDDVTFAPDDFEDPLCNPKENTFGLGYSGLDRTALSFGPVDLFGGHGGIQTRVENRKLNIRGEAFGIGAFEDEDEEVYHRSDMSQYDFSLETPQERKSRRGKERNIKDEKRTEKAESGIIPGFLRAKNPPRPRKFFPAPTLPKTFEPKHYIRRSRFDQLPSVDGNVPEAEKKKLGLDRHRLTIQERQVLLGEQQVPLTPEEQQEAEAKSKADAEEARKKLAREKAERLKKFTEVLQTYTAKKTSQTDSSNTREGFKPFMKNPEKQERYEKYMTLCAAGFEDSLKDLQPLDMTEWERERERMEFERASALYKPLGSVISSRFVSAQSHDISHLVPTKEILQEKDPTQDPKVAAKMGLFGKLTHKIFEWHPDRLLCKRFNVPHPYPESKMIGVIRRDVTSAAPVIAVPDTKATEAEQKPPPVKKSLFDNIDFSKPPPGLLPIPQPTSEEGICPPGTENEKESTAKPDEKESASHSPVEPEIVKPSIDLFREIFENSSSESEEEPLPQPIPSKATRFDRGKDIKESHHDKGKSDNPSKPKGIFDNLDFSKLESPGTKALTLDKSRTQSLYDHREFEIGKNKTGTERESDDEGIYGPAPPRGESITPKSRFSKDSTNVNIHSFEVPSKGKGKVIPINLPLQTEDHEVIWVEKGSVGVETDRIPKSNSITSASKGRTKKSHKQKKKLREKPRHPTKSKKSKSKKRKDQKHKKLEKRKKAGGNQRDSSDSKGSNDDCSDSSSSDSSIEIHQSFNSKALLSKLKDLTRTS